VASVPAGVVVRFAAMEFLILKTLLIIRLPHERTPFSGDEEVVTWRSHLPSY